MKIDSSLENKEREREVGVSSLLEGASTLQAGSCALELEFAKRSQVSHLRVFEF